MTGIIATSLDVMSRRFSPQTLASRTSGVIKRCVLFLVASSVVFGVLGADTPQPLEKQREALSRWQTFIGDWRGVGMPRRGSNKDAWTEECGWVWSFADSRVALSHNSPNGKYFRSSRLALSSETGKFELLAITPAGATVKYVGTSTNDGSLLLSLADNEQDGIPSRITIRLVAEGDRMLVLYEQQSGQDRYTRLAEVGFTRKGSNFGKGTNSIECIVTGGTGTIPVTHQGQTYYVCCTGCRDYFQDHPDKVLAEYRARKEAAKKEKNKP